eukprot:c3741_g1_i1.p1 GENE.c3741_g1_i1~~c3741_g1_i1.p1  ORF type:complete len:488 (+),score=128.92 c3741_g1_i1:92-1465(+)
MIIRIRAPSGQHRVTVEDSSNLDQLKHLIEELSGIPSASQDIHLDNGAGRPSPAAVKGRTLAECNVTHGSLVHVKQIQEVAIDALAESRKNCSLDLKEYAKQKQQKQEEEEKIRASMFGSRTGWSANTVTFKQSNKLQLLKAQKDRICVQAQVTSASIKTLVKEVEKSHFSVQRCAFIYGAHKYRKERVSVMRWKEVALQDESVQTTKMRMETMWQPPQIGDHEGVIILDDEDSKRKVARAEELASMLGLECVGLIVTVPIQNARSQEGLCMRARDIVQAAGLQAKYGSGFVTIIVPVGQDEMGHTWSSSEAWQVTEAGVQLWRQGDMEDKQEKDSMLNLKDVVTVYRGQPDSGVKEVQTLSVEVEMFQKKVALIPHRTRFMRPTLFSGDLHALKGYLTQYKHLPWQKRIADFNVLLLLCDEMDIKSDMPALCLSVRTQCEVSEGFVLIIQAAASML